MDEEIDPDGEDVNTVLAQEFSELLFILNSQPLPVIKKLVPNSVRWQSQLPSSDFSVEVKERFIKATLEYFCSANAAECGNFLQSVCVLCENIPMHLESRLLSAAGYATTRPLADSTDFPGGYENVWPTLTDQNLPSPSSEPQFIKRPRIDHWEQYAAAVRRLLQWRWRRVTKHLVREVHLESVWVCPRTINRGRDRPDQTPNSADRGSRTPEIDGNFGRLEPRMTLETFLQGISGKVTVLTGQAGSGKSLLMSCLGQQWANRLGPVPSSHLFVLLEFRQLNLLSLPLSLSELLFNHYLLPEGDDIAKRAIVDYLLSNPEQSCWVLDGYDEFQHKINRLAVQREDLDLEIRLPVADLVSGLLNRQILPGSTVLVTCRLRDVGDLDVVSDQMGQLLEWDENEIKEYVKNFFDVKGQAHGTQATDLLFSSRQLLAMSSLPSLCNICCICLWYLLLEKQYAGEKQSIEDSGCEGRKQALEKEAHLPAELKQQESLGGETCRQTRRKGERREESENASDETNGEAQLPQRRDQVPSTLTQVYLMVLSVFLSRDIDQNGRDEQPQIPTSLLRDLRQYQSQLCELSRLAWRGFEEGKILFVEDDIPQEVLEFSIRTGLLSQVELRCQKGMPLNAYCFIHLTVQEFLAALRVMTSNDVTDALLKKRFNLKTRWTTSLDQRTVFTDSLYLYVCGLASPQCTQALVQLAAATGGTGVQAWIQKRQAFIKSLLKSFCQSNKLTGPKILELCHCLQESQDHELAKQVMDARPTLELRNIWLSLNDIDALAFVVNSGGDNDIGLDIGSCSMQLECLDVLPRCHNIRCLSFRSRKYGDKFAEKLSTILPEFRSLKKLEFCGTSLTDAGAASLVSGLQRCPHITELNLSDNNLKDEGIKHVAEIFTELQGLFTVLLGRNNTSLKSVNYLIEKMSSCSNIQCVHADWKKELNVTFYKNSYTKSHKTKPAPVISLLNHKWNNNDMQKLAKLLTHIPALSVLDLSGGQWTQTRLKLLTKFLPKLNITEKIIMNEICSSLESMFLLTALLSACPTVMELNIRLQSPIQASMVFSREKPMTERTKVLCVNSCNLEPAHLEKLLKKLGRTSDLTVLDLSCNSLGNKGLQKLLDGLPFLRKIRKINVSSNDITMEGVVLLAGVLSSHNKLIQADISNSGKDEVILKFCSDKSNDKQLLKMFGIHNSSLLPSDVTTVCEKLAKCRSPLELWFTHSSLTNKAVGNLLKMLPEMASLQKLNLSHSVTSTDEALMLLSCLTDDRRVSSVDLSLRRESSINFVQVKVEPANCRLTHFCLRDENLERFLEILHQSPELSELDLSNNQLEDKGVKSLVDLLLTHKISRYVNLSCNTLSHCGMLEVANTLHTCPNVFSVEVNLGAEEKCLIWFSSMGVNEKSLSIRESSLMKEHLVQLAEILLNSQTVVKLKLKSNSLQSAWIEDFIKLLASSHNEHSISIEERWIEGERAVHLLCRCLDVNSSIQSIRIQQNTLRLTLKSTELNSISDDSAEAARQATKKIGLVDCALNDVHLESMRKTIQKCPLLTELDFSHSFPGVKEAEILCSFLPSLPNLTTLSIASKDITVALAETLLDVLQTTTIQHVDLSGYAISDTAAENMSRLLPRLRSLNLSHCVWSVAGGLQLTKALGLCVSLEELCLDSVQLNEESWIYLAQALRNTNSVRKLMLNKISTEGKSCENSVLDLLAAMEVLTQLEEIGLDGWRMADKGVEKVTRLLPKWRQLRKIVLSENLISDQSGASLLESLKSCTHLKELHLSRNKLGDLTAAQMAVVLPSLTQLSVLEISENRIKTEGSICLSKAIKCMKNLRKIQLTSIGTSELCAVAASLAHCPLLQDVSLGWNQCGNNVALELAKALPSCHHLARIDLESNSITVTGAEALVKALKCNLNLQVIRLWKNNVSPSETHQLTLQDRRLNFSPT